MRLPGGDPSNPEVEFIVEDVPEPFHVFELVFVLAIRPLYGLNLTTPVRS